MNPRQAGLRLILFTLPFLALGLLLGLAPPAEEALGEATVVVQVLGIALALLAVASLGLGVFLMSRGREKVL